MSTSSSRRDHRFDSPETLAVIADVHSLLEHQPGIGNVWSLDTLRRWLAEKLSKTDVATLKQYVDMLPPYLTRRFISAEQDAVIVSGRVPDSDASQLLPIVDRIDQQLNGVRAKYPGYKIGVTGLSVISARNSALMIDKLSRGLTIEIDIRCRIYRHRLLVAHRHADKYLAGTFSDRVRRKSAAASGLAVETQAISTASAALKFTTAVSRNGRFIDMLPLMPGSLTFIFEVTAANPSTAKARYALGLWLILAAYPAVARAASIIASMKAAVRRVSFMRSSPFVFLTRLTIAHHLRHRRRRCLQWKQTIPKPRSTRMHLSLCSSPKLH